MDVIEISGVWLRKIDRELQVCVEVDGQWKRVLTDHCEGPISHIVETSGIRKAPADEGPIG